MLTAFVLLGHQFEMRGVFEPAYGLVLHPEITALTMSGSPCGAASTSARPPFTRCG